MENLPKDNNHETDDDESESSSKQKRAEALGVFAVEPKSAKREPASEKDELKRTWDRILGGKSDGQSVLLGVEKPDQKHEDLEEIGETQLDTLTDDELHYAEREIAVAHQEADATQQEADEAAIVAEAAVERFRDRIIEEAMSSDEAYAETLSELEANDNGEAKPDVTSGEIDDDEGVIELNHGSNDDDEADPASAPTPGGAGGTGTPPPPSTPPTPPAGRPVPPAGPPSGPAFGPPLPPMPGSAPAASPNAAPVQNGPVERYTRTDVVSAALVGGIIGYLIGRRRGRIKTERKLLPVQKKLEQQVEGLQQDILNKEAKIRSLAREKAHALSETYVAQAASARAERSLNNRFTSAPEARELHAKPVSPEKIGKVLIAGEVIRRATREIPAAETSKTAVEKHTETMSRQELLLISEKITIDGTSLRQVFETRLIGEKGLRRLVAEYLKGGDVQKALRLELTEHEIDFERDPIMRDHAGAQLAQTPTAQLEQLLASAALGSSEAAQEAKMLQARADYQAKEAEVQQKQRKLIDIGLGSTIVVLLALIIFLAVTHR